MKIVEIDNFARDSVAEKVVAENLTYDEAQIKLEELTSSPTRPYDKWYMVATDEYKLWRGLEELI